MKRDTNELPSTAMGESQRRPGRRHADGPIVGLTGARFGGAAGRRCRQPEPPPEDDSMADNGLAKDESDPGRSPGVRSATEEGPALDHPDPFESSRGSSGATQLGPTHWVGEAQWRDETQLRGETQLRDETQQQGDEAPEDESDWEGPAESYDLVRPYSWTGGRTSSGQDLALEALISATGRMPHPTAGPEHHAILGLCTTPRSVAEVAALLSVPIGVARVVLGDMAEAGSVVVHATAGSADGTPDLALMQRVLTCLQRL